MSINDKSIIYREDVKKVDNKTGEVINTTTRRLSKVKRTPDFIMLYTKHVAFLEKLTKGETAVLSEILGKYVGIENLLNMSPAIRATITKKLDVDKSYVNKAISGLTKKKIISKDENGLSFLNPHLFGKGNWEDIHKLRHEIAYDFDFETLEAKETRKIAISYDADFDMNQHNIIEANKFKDKNGVETQEIVVQENLNQQLVSFEEPKKQEFYNELELINAKNKTKELAIEEMKLKLKMHELGL